MYIYKNLKEMQLTLRSAVVLQNHQELFKVYVLMVDFKSLSRSHLEFVKKFDNIFHFKISSRVL